MAAAVTWSLRSRSDLVTATRRESCKRETEGAIVKLINDNGLNSKTAPIFVQSFDPASLKYMRSIGLAARVVQLIDGNDVNYAAGEMAAPPRQRPGGGVKVECEQARRSGRAACKKTVSGRL